MAHLDSPRRHSSISAVMIAVVFLALLGASVGFILATQRGGPDTPLAGDQTGASGSPTVTVDPRTGQTRTVEPSAAATGNTKSPSPKTSSRTYQPPTGHACPDLTIEAAKARGGKGEPVDFKLQLYVKTNKSEVWICADADDRLFYQGHVLGKPFSAATSDSTLFLTSVEPVSDGYQATNTNGGKSTKYFVSPSVLEIEYGDGETEEQIVVESNS